MDNHSKREAGGERRGTEKGQQMVTKVNGIRNDWNIEGFGGKWKSERKRGGHIVQVPVRMYVWFRLLGHRPVSLITS